MSRNKPATGWINLKSESTYAGTAGIHGGDRPSGDFSYKGFQMKKLLVLVTMAALGLFSLGCEKQADVNTAVEDAAKAGADAAKDAADATADAVKDAVQGATDAAKDAADTAADAAKDAAETAKDAAKDATDAADAAKDAAKDATDEKKDE